MTEEGILRITTNGEGTEIEYKESRTGLARSVYESICAFLNRKGTPLLEEKDEFKVCIPYSTGNKQDEVVPISSSGQKVARKWPEDWPETKRKIIDAIIAEPTITISLLEQQLEKGHTIIKKYIKQLQDEGYLKRIGSDKSGKWESIDNDN